MSQSNDSKTRENRLVCIILAAGHGNLLEQEIKAESTGKFKHLVGVPKALLPINDGQNQNTLSRWWELVNKRFFFSDVYLVTNANKYKYFERWATANSFPRENIVNNGSTCKENQQRGGSVADIQLVLNSKNIFTKDIMIVAGDMMFEDKAFDISSVVSYFHASSGNVAVYYDLDKEEDPSTRGMIEINDKHKIQQFYEKPTKGMTDSTFASVVFYCFRKETYPLLSQWLHSLREQVAATNLKIGPKCKDRKSFGHFMEYIVSRMDVYGLKLPTKFLLIGNVSLKKYQECLQYYQKKNSERKYNQPICCRAYARVGVLGNPSDGFHGKTIALSISNYWAEATIARSDTLRLTPHPLNDPNEFGSLNDLYSISNREGYQGGLRLMQATCKRFFSHCLERGIALHKHNFTLSYDTNIPRQVGLSGSSAIVTAVFHCLLEFYGITLDDIPQESRPTFVLSVESELGIQAGLQDRVIQAYEGLMFMDFNPELMKLENRGNYERLPLENLPRLWLAYLAEPSDSGKIHSDIKLKWMNGDDYVVSQMAKFKKITDDGRQALLEGDFNLFGQLIDANFNLRQSIYGDAVLGNKNIMMINIARKYGAAAKFPGSGGAVVGTFPELEEDYVQMKSEFECNGCVFVTLEPNPPGKH